MSTNIGPKISIEGEREYNKQIKDISTGLKTLGSEMKVVTSEFAGQEKSTEALSAKNDVLERTVLSLNEQLELQEDRLKKLADAYGEANPATQKAQQAVNNTKAAINKANAEIKANNEQIGKNSSLLGQLEGGLDDVAEKLGLPTSAFNSGAIAAGAFSAAVVKLGSELVKLSDEATKYADNINTMSQRYGVAVQDIQKLQYMEKFTDVPVDTVLESMSKLIRSMNSAKDGTGAAAEAFSSLGISVTNASGTLRNSQEVFNEAIVALGKIKDPTERDAKAMEIFGKNAQALNGYIAAGPEGLEALAKAAEESGAVMSDKMVAVLQRGQDATDKFDLAMDSLGKTIGAGVTPIVAGWKEVLADAAEGMNNFIQIISGMKDGADNTADAVNGVADAVNGMNKAISGVRDLNANDALDMTSGIRNEYIKYLRQANATQQAMGQNIGIASYDQFAAAYNKAQTINLRVDLDGRTIAEATYDANRDEANRVGGHAIR